MDAVAEYYSKHPVAAAARVVAGVVAARYRDRYRTPTPNLPGVPSYRNSSVMPRVRSGHRGPYTSTPVRLARARARHDASSVARFTGGPYVGPFNRVRPVKDSRYQLNGYVREVEWNKQISQPDAVYVGGTASRSDQLGRAVTAALLRRFLRYSRGINGLPVDIVNEDQAMSATVNIQLNIGYVQNDNTPAVVLPRPSEEVNETSSTATQPFSGIEILIADSFFTVVTKLWAKLLFLISRGFKPVYLRAGSNSIPTNAYGVMWFDQMHVKAYSTLTVFLQNATTADGGGSTVVEVASNPVQYRLCSFHGRHPEIAGNIQGYATALGEAPPAMDGWPAYQNQKPEGPIVPYFCIDGSNNWTIATPQGEWRCLPTKNTFANCKYMASGYLQPGQIRSYKTKYRMSGYIPDVLYRCAEPYIPYAFDQSTAYRKYNRKIELRGNHKSFMFVFEKMVHTGANSVVINADFEMSTGAVTGKHKVSCIKSFTNEYDATLANVRAANGAAQPSVDIVLTAN